MAGSVGCRASINTICADSAAGARCRITNVMNEPSGNDYSSCKSGLMLFNDGWQPVTACSYRWVGLRRQTATHQTTSPSFSLSCTCCLTLHFTDSCAQRLACFIRQKLDSDGSKIWSLMLHSLPFSSVILHFPLTDYHQTYTSDALCERGEHIKFCGERSRS